jgi:hypothetical protein
MLFDMLADPSTLDPPKLLVMARACGEIAKKSIVERIHPNFILFI